MGVTRFNLKLYLLKESPLRVLKKAFSATFYYTLAMKNSRTSSTIQIPYISIRLFFIDVVK